MDVSPFVWKDRILPIYTEVFPYPQDFTKAEISEPPIFFSQKARGKDAGYHPYYIDLNSEGFDDNYTIKVQQTRTYASVFPAPEDADKSELAACFRAFLTADNLQYTNENRAQNALDLITRFEQPEGVEAKKMLQQAEAFFKQLKSDFTIKKVWRKYPVRLHYKGRLFTTEIDLLLKTETGLVILQHNTFAGEAKAWRSKAEKEAGDWFFLTKKAVQKIFDTPDVQTICHFVAGGAYLEVDIKERVLV